MYFVKVIYGKVGKDITEKLQDAADKYDAHVESSFDTESTTTFKIMATIVSDFKTKRNAESYGKDVQKMLKDRLMGYTVFQGS